MENILWNFDKFDNIYDLKGSSYKRYTPKSKKNVPLKDQNFVEDNIFLELNEQNTLNLKA